MSSRFRIPKAELTGPFGRFVATYCRRLYGQVPDVAHVAFHHPQLLRHVLGFEKKVARWSALDAHLKAYATIASAAVIGCSWCLDFGYHRAQHEGLELAKLSQVPLWREAEVFTALERDVMAYAEAMTATPPEVTDELVARLLEELGSPAMVELTEMIGLENMRSRVNHAAGLESQGFSASCEIPLAGLERPSGGGVGSNS